MILGITSGTLTKNNVILTFRWPQWAVNLKMSIPSIDQYFIVTWYGAEAQYFYSQQDRAWNNAASSSHSNMINVHI